MFSLEAQVLQLLIWINRQILKSVQDSHLLLVYQEYKKIVKLGKVKNTV